MSNVVKPSWDLFDRLLAEAKREFIICAPWVTDAGLQHLGKLWLKAQLGKPLPCVQIWARVADINTDSPGILKLVKMLEATGGVVEVRDSPVLHAKLYLADRSLALVTSANLSQGGFCSNLEAAVVISDQAGIEAVAKLLAEIKSETVVVSTADLEFFVTNQWPSLVKELKESSLTVPQPIVPVWRTRTGTAKQPAPDLPAISAGPTLRRSRTISWQDLAEATEASIKAAHEQIESVNLVAWIGRRVRVWVCPCHITTELSPYLTSLSAPYFSGELQLGQVLPPERFTMLHGTIEKVLDRGRALFRKQRARESRIELTRYPDRGSRNALNNTDSRFLLKIQDAC